MIATLLAMTFSAAAILAIGVIVLGWKNFGYRFQQLRCELRATQDPIAVRYARREVGARATATVYNLDFKAKADGLPFHPELRHDLRVAA